MRPEMVERFVFLTGDLVDPRTRAFLDRVKRPVIEKPFRAEELVRVVREQLGRRALAPASSRCDETS